MRRVIEHEVAANPKTLAAIKLHKGPHGFSKSDLTLHTTLFQVHERATAKITQAAVEGEETAHMGFECDGDVFYRLKPSGVSLSDWRLRVLAKGCVVHEHLAIKPYKSQEELTLELETSYPEADWRVCEADWRERTVAKLELIGRLVAGESGMDMLLKPLVPYRILRLCGADYRLKDIYKAAPGGRELDVLAFNVKFGRWELMPAVVACENLSDECAATVIDLLQARGIEDVPKWVRQGASMRAAAAGVVRSKLYDKDHYMSLDNPSTLAYLVFGDGVMFHRDTWETSRMDPSIPISHHMGVDFPKAQFEALQEQWGKRVQVIFKAIHTLECMQGGTYKHKVVFPPSIVSKLEELAKDVPALLVLYSCFESWEVALYVLKLSAKTIFARTRIEQLWVWLGRGRNGKGWLMEVLSTLLGTYATNPSLDLVTSKLPPANGPSPALLALRGVRGAFITEAEQSLRLYTSTCKLIRDHASKLTSRNLFKDLVTFRPCCSLIVSTNVKVTFTTVDEGLQLSLGVVNWPFQFVKCPTEPQHRIVRPGLKDAADVAAMVPSLFWLLAHVDRAFVKDWSGTIVGPEPLQVQEAQKEFLRAKGESSVEAFLEESCVETTDSKAATTEARLMVAFVEYMGKTMSKQQAQVSFDAAFAGAITAGRRLCRTKYAPRGLYLQLK